MCGKGDKDIRSVIRMKTKAAFTDTNTQVIQRLRARRKAQPFRQYLCQCKGCRKKLRDPLDNLIYLPDEDEYWCSQKCMDKNDPVRKEAIEND